MANNPKTYDCRVDLRNLFSALSACRRAALRELPIDFFVHFFGRVISKLKHSYDYRALCVQAWTSYYQSARAHKSTKTQDVLDWKDVTLELFNEELKLQNVNNIDAISSVYEEYILSSYWLLLLFQEVATNFNVVPNNQSIQ